jgi:hypothetical protein
MRRQRPQKHIAPFERDIAERLNPGDIDDDARHPGARVTPLHEEIGPSRQYARIAAVLVQGGHRLLNGTCDDI